MNAFKLDSTSCLNLVLTETYYSWPSVFVGSKSTDSNNCGSKIFEKNTPEISKKQNLNLLHVGNYLHSIYIVLGIISNLDMIWRI